MQGRRVESAGRMWAAALLARVTVLYAALFAILFAALFAAGTAWARESPKPDLKVTATLDADAPEGEPFLVIHLVNQSGHALRIPEPPLLCTPAPGAFWLDAQFTPENGGHRRPAGACDLEVDGSGLADIRERAKSWLTLKQGQDYEIRRPLAMGLDISQPGSYEFRVIYDGPAAGIEDAQKLKGAGIRAPGGRFESGKITYKAGAPR